MSKLTELFGHTMPDSLKPAQQKPKVPNQPIHELVNGNYPPGLEGKVFVSPTTEPIDLTACNPMHPLILKWAGIPNETAPNLLFLDTETTGLSGGTGTLPFMIGIGWMEQGNFQTRQYFMTDPAYEVELLKLLRSDVSAFDTVVTFNGKSFDMNLLDRRFIFHGIENPFHAWGHIDLLHLSRRLWKRILPGCSLQQLEVSLQLVRREGIVDIPGSMIPQVYFNYLRYGQANELKNVFYHNRIDVQSMIRLLEKISITLQYPHFESESGDQVIDPVAIARLFDDMGEVQRSIEIYEYKLSTSDDIDCVMNLSFLFKRMGELEKAKPLWEIGAERGNMIACIELAKRAEHCEKDLADALRWTEKAFSTLDDSNPLAMTLFDELTHRRNRLLSKMEKK